PAIPAPPPTISRGFFLWRLSDAGLGARRTAAIGRHPKPSTKPEVPRALRMLWNASQLYPQKADLTLGANDVGSYFENGNGVRQSE
ncbi:hypothetical protein, partial [Bradyrhizobium sp.]|uniref:hypothetical protein n=1 Tax=Bradyrhizobium sp. TaxID=376 RepID=UPI003C275E58